MQGGATKELAMQNTSRMSGLGMLVACLMISGCPPALKTVPNVDGLTQAAASAAITGAGLALGTVTQEYSDTVPAGEVVSQNPAAGAGVAPGAAVSLAVSETIDTIMLPGDVPLEMVWIPGGTFTMGSPDTEQDRNSNEGPQHAVTLDGFWVGRYNLTQAQWAALMGGNPSYFQGANAGGVTTDNRPVESVSWDDAQAFITRINLATGMSFRLPSEAEWEYVCRAGTATRFYWGDDLNYTNIGNYAWYQANSGNQTHDSGGKAPNNFGLYDMSGNVAEWCQDWYHDSYAGAPADGSAWETPTESSHVVRAGGWYGYGYCRSAARNNGSTTSDDIGFRLAR